MAEYPGSTTAYSPATYSFPGAFIWTFVTFNSPTLLTLEYLDQVWPLQADLHEMFQAMNDTIRPFAKLYKSTLHSVRHPSSNRPDTLVHETLPLFASPQYCRVTNN